MRLITNRYFSNNLMHDFGAPAYEKSALQHRLSPTGVCVRRVRPADFFTIKNSFSPSHFRPSIKPGVSTYLRQHTCRLDNLDPFGKVGPGSRPHAGRDCLLPSAATAEWPRIYRPGAHRSLIGKVRNMLAKLHLYYKIINNFIITTQNRRLIVIPCNSRAGKTVEQGTGYLAFIPADVPPTPPVAFDTAMIQLLSAADLALGQLSGIAALLPNPDLFVAMYVKKEAVLSSQIEGIACTLDEVIAQEESDAGVQTKAIGEVVNYVNATNSGMERLKTLPLCLRLIREVHGHLMSGVRGEHKDPGEFRKTQNWIGPQGCTLATATFVPPPVPDMNKALANLELFLHDRTSLPLTIQCAIIHAQFETIHPFLDGNGRVGRLLVALLLHERSVLKQPLLYMSLYLKLNRREYYDHLMAVRTHGEWEGWIKFFLIGLAAVSKEAASTAQNIVAFREDALRRASKYGQHEIKLLDVLFAHPILDIRAAERHLACTYATAATAMKNLDAEGFVTEITGQKRNKRFKFTGYLKYFEVDTITTAQDAV